MIKALQSAREAVEQEAQTRHRPLRDFAATLIVLVATPDGVAAAQVGDGGAVVGDGEGNVLGLTAPQSGEYINETTFLTSPDSLPAAQGHASIAWPVDLLHTVDGGRRCVGFLMPRIVGMRLIIDFYHPKTRRHQSPLFDYFYLHRIARNLTAAVHALHARGYVIGDVNESNFFVSDGSINPLATLVTLVDTDSFQVRDPQNGVVYRCPVGKPEFTPPELQGKSFAQVDRAPEHDHFGLAVFIFQLLMEGTHPFAGISGIPLDFLCLQM